MLTNSWDPLSSSYLVQSILNRMVLQSSSLLKTFNWWFSLRDQAKCSANKSTAAHCPVAVSMLASIRLSTGRFWTEDHTRLVLRFNSLLLKLVTSLPVCRVVPSDLHPACRRLCGSASGEETKPVREAAIGSAAALSLWGNRPYFHLPTRPEDRQRRPATTWRLSTRCCCV